LSDVTGGSVISESISSSANVNESNSSSSATIPVDKNTSNSRVAASPGDQGWAAQVFHIQNLLCSVLTLTGL